MNKFNFNRGIFWAWIFMLTLDFVTVKMGAASRRSGSSRGSAASHTSSRPEANRLRPKVPNNVHQADFNGGLPSERSGGASTIRSSTPSQSFRSFNSSTEATEPSRQSVGAQTQGQQRVAGVGGAPATGGRRPGFALPPNWETRGVQATQGNARPYEPKRQAATSQSSVARGSPREQVGPKLPPSFGSKQSVSGTGARSSSDGASVTSSDHGAVIHYHNTSVSETSGSVMSTQSMGTQWGSTPGREASVVSTNVSTKMTSKSRGSIAPSQPETVSNLNRASIFRDAIQRQEQGQGEGGSSTHEANQPKRAPEGKSFSEYTNAEMLGYIRNQRALDPSAASMWDQVEKMWSSPMSPSLRGPATQGSYSPFSLFPSENAAPYSLGAFSTSPSRGASSAPQLTSNRGSGQGRIKYPPLDASFFDVFPQYRPY